MWMLFATAGNIMWSVSDIFNSILVKYFHKSPLLISWFQSLFDLCFLLIFALIFDVKSGWIIPLAIAGAVSYGGHLAFFYILDRLDVSVLNASWAFMAVFITIAGFIFFGDRWSITQTAGVILIFSGVFFLSFWHKHVSLFNTIGLLMLLGSLYAPFYIVQKAALISGDSILAAFFWPTLAAKICAFFSPVFNSELRSNIRRLKPKAGFCWLNISAVVLSLFGFLAMTQAYKLGQASLVAITENMQPFLVISMAWAAVKISPKFTPRELLTRQSVQIKIISFTVVFAGLFLLNFSN